MTDTATKEHITEFRTYARNNYSCTNEQRIHAYTHPATMAGLAAALDRARIEAANRLGCSGQGSGAWVEAVFGADEDQNVLIDGLDSAVLSDCEPLEIGASRLALARRAGRRERERYWDGRNQVRADAPYTRELIDRISNAD